MTSATVRVAGRAAVGGLETGTSEVPQQPPQLPETDRLAQQDRTAFEALFTSQAADSPAIDRVPRIAAKATKGSRR